MSTTLARPATIERGWYLIDASGLTVGRLATRVAMVLRGKHKPTFTPYMDTGDFVVIVNAEKVVFSGRKLDQKQYHNYSGYPGGLRSRTAREVLANDPTRILTAAIKGMLPKNRLSRQVIKKLKIYAGAEHPHVAQQPQPFPAFV